jgi:hypothetical protein
MIQFIRPQPRFQIPVSRIEGWLAGSSPKSCGDEPVHTFGNLRASSEVCVHENAQQQILEYCRGLSIFQFRRSALSIFQCASHCCILWGQKPNFHRENLKVAPSAQAAVRLARSGGTFRQHAWHVPGVRMLDVPGSTGSRLKIPICVPLFGKSAHWGALYLDNHWDTF